MKTFCIFLLVLSTIHSHSIQAQVRKKIYRIHVEVESGAPVKGYLIALQDSAIQVWIPGRVPLDTVVSVKNIQSLSVRRRNGPGRGFGYGLLAGAGIGALVGYASYSPPDCDGSFICLDFGPGLSALAGGFLGGSAGSIIGLIGGSAYRKHMIYRDQPSYEAFKRKILNGPKSTLARSRLTTYEGLSQAKRKN